VEKFIAGIFIKVISDPTVQAEAKKLLGQLITEQILPLVPIAVAAATKAAVDEVIAKVPGITGVVDVVRTTEAAVASLENLIPGLPVLTDLLQSWGINLP
jgi:hypothetical protein